jgi:hypothetical protein
MSPAVNEISPLERAALRPAELFALSPSGRAEFRIQRQLKNYNSGFGGGNRNAHWSRKHASMKTWQTALSKRRRVRARHAPRRSSCSRRSRASSARKAPRCDVRRRIEIIRWVPSKRNFVKRHLREPAEHREGTARRAEEDRPDSRRQHEVDGHVDQQAVSNDGTYWTWIAIDDTGGGMTDTAAIPQEFRAKLLALISNTPHYFHVYRGIDDHVGYRAPFVSAADLRRLLEDTPAADVTTGKEPQR